jgi:hypothetical protein
MTLPLLIIEKSIIPPLIKESIIKEKINNRE